MFEGAIAAFLNRLLGRYVEDLDTEQFNVGIFSGDTCLTDLKLKPEALYQLGLPIRVEIGLIGKIILKIPWSGLFSQPIVICIEDIYAVAVPALSGPYDPEIQKRLIRAEKKKILEDLKDDEIFRAGLPPQLFDGLLASVTKNFQITINNVHIRYEEKILRNFLCACGICIQSISITTTNNKWKPGVCATNSQTVYQLIRAESLSVYMDHDTESCINVPCNWDMPNLFAWKSAMHRALQTFGMKNKDFQFLLKPFTAKIKVIIHKGTETQASRMLVDIVLQDVAMQLSEAQYATFCHIHDSLLRAIINRPHLKFRPERSVYEEPSSWWKYAYNSILNYYVKPYTWSHIVEHRQNYRKYKEACIQSLQRPNDTELKLDLQKYQDSLTILNIVIAREHARQELRNKDIERECQIIAASPSKDVSAESILTSNDEMQNAATDHSKSESQKLSIDVAENSSSSKTKLEKLEKTLKQIDYKLNFTLANCCLSLLNKGKEMLVVTVAQFLTSIEARPTLLAFKISARAESFVIEAISSDGDLIPLVTVDNVLTGNVSTYFLAIDFEKNRLNMDPIFEVSIKLEAIEVTYHHFAMVEMINFFKFNISYIHDTVLGLYKLWDYITRKYLSFIDDIVSQTLRISFKIDIKSPYIIFPEYGSIQKGGHILVLDLGNITLTNELQATNLQLEDATLMELEELLYDRLNMIFSGAQILFCHSGDDWRLARKRSDSEYHLLPKLQANATLSYSIKPEYRQLPRTKLNVHISNVKFNLSESKLRLMAYFLNKLLLLYQDNVEKYKVVLNGSAVERKSNMAFISAKELIRVQSSICLPSVTMMHSDFKSVVKEVTTVPKCVPKLDRSVVSSEVSEEDLELLSKTINLSGFDDNISPCNHINLLLRFAIGEFSINLEHTVDNREQPYLNLRLHTLYYETAMMEYGVAVQFGIGSILLVDKTNAGVTGSYLELISTDQAYEVFVVSYRKVKSNCPDFKSHFKNIERSLIVNLLNINVNFHRSALLKMRDYWHRFQTICHGTILFKFAEKVCSNIMKREQKGDDPPIPPGAIKLNYSTRLSSLVLRFCDKDIDLMEIKIAGLENDCIYNANERMVLRVHLRSIFAEDLNDDTLYSKILTTDEDKVFDLKYVRHMPRLYKCPDIDTNQDDVMSDGTFKLSIGRINCVIISKILYDLQNFITPFTSVYYTRFLNYLRDKFVGGIQVFKRSATKLHIFIDIQGPTFLLPQKKDAPSLLVFDTGVLSVENFFKKSGQSAQSNKASVSDVNQLIIDNILVKLKSMTISRAIMTLTRDLEVQEPIIEPIQIQFDIKRKTEYRSIIELQAYGLFNVQGAIDIVNINLSQRDLKSLMSVWQDNISKILLLKKAGENEDRTSTLSCQKNVKHDDAMVKKLEDFLAHNETALCEVNVKLTLEGLQLNLFLDTEEVLSSPVRDLNHGLCKLSFGETINTWDFYSDKSLKMKLSLQNCLLQDTRKESVSERKIIQSPAISLEKNLESCISVSMSPIVDVTYSRTQAEEKCLDVLIQDVRINLSVPFLMHLGRYFLDSLPGEQIEKGIINHGYDNNNQTNRNALNAETDKLNRSQYFKEQPGTSVSIRIQKPDIFLFGDLEKSNTHVIRMQAEVFIESSRHSCSSSIVCTLTNVNAKTKGQGNYESPCWLLRPCDIEICKKKELSSGNEEITVAINSINIHLSAEVVHTFVDILNEASIFLNSISLKADDGSNNQNTNMHNNLWTPRKVSSIPYKKTDEGDSELFCRRHDHVIFNLKPVLVCLLLEMEYSIGRFPVMRMEAIITTTVNDWHNSFHLESNVKLHAFCYNRAHQSWEPLVEFCTNDDVNYKPWEFTIKTYQAEANMINSNWIDPYHHIKQDPMKVKKRDMRHNGQDVMDMVFIGPDVDAISSTRNEPETYVTCEDESDTDDDESDKKLARISNYLFNSNSSDEEESDSDDSSTNEDEGLDFVLDCNAESCHPAAPAKMNLSAPHIILYTEEKINITVTQNMIETWNAIMSAFVQAKGGLPFVPTNTRGLTVLNDIGHASRIELLVQEQVDGNSVIRVIATHNFHDGSSPISVPSSPENETQTDFTSPQWVGKDIHLVMPECKAFPIDSPVHIYKSITGELLRVVFEGFEEVLVYCPKKETRNLVSLRPVKHEVRYYLVIEASINSYLHRTICVRSPLQFRNETSYALGLYYKKAVVDKLGLIPAGETTNPFDDNVRMAIIEPDSTYNIPLYIAYHCSIYVLPAYLEKYQVSDDGIYWKDLRGTTNAFKDVCCETKDDINSNVFCVRAICTEVPLTTRPSGCQVPNYLINIIPPVIFNNQLPFVIDVSIPSINYEVKIEPGEKINMHSLNCNSNVQFVFKIHNYLGTSWIGTVKLNMNLERKFVLMSTDNESDLTKPFLLCIELCKMLSWNIIVQSQYWIINKSGLPLFIQECHTHTTYEMPEEELMVFSQKNNKKNTVRLRAHQSEWSMPFGLDGITSMSLVVCRDIERGRKYQILTEVESSRLSPFFTKIITFLPYFLICNKTKRALRFMEENEEADLWNDLLPAQEMSFWPVTESMKMRIKWRNSQLVSQHFDITHAGKTVLRMDNGSALCVEIEGGINTPYRIMFRKYNTADIPVRVDNLCDKLFLKLNQVNLGQVALLKPFQSLLYTWDDPTQTRELIWNVYNNNAIGYRAEFETDGCGHERVSFLTVERRNSASMHSSINTKSLSNARSWSEDTSGSTTHLANTESESKAQTLENMRQDEAEVYWVSYMESEQRVLLFTQHESVFLKAKSIIDPETSKREMYLSIAAIGISIVVQESSVSLHSSRRELLYASMIDSSAHWELYFSKRWKSLSLELSAWLENKYMSSAKGAQLENLIDVDFTKMQMTKPFFGKLRRTYSPGIWLHRRESTTLCYLQGYVHRIQIDNQLSEATFPVVLYPSLQKGFVNYAGGRRLKHCLEFSYLKQRKLRNTIYKGICVIVREFNLNLEETFLYSLINLIPKIPETKHSIAAKLRRDVSNMRVPSLHKISNNTNGKRKDLIEQIYVSPMVLRLKLLANTEGSNARNFDDVADYHNIVQFVFEYAEKGVFERDVKFRLPGYRRSFIVVDNKQFLSHLSRTYMAQIMEQFHVLVRLTTVLGNQYGYNFKLPGGGFYEPDLLLLYGDETAERLAHDVACELGYVTHDGMQVFNSHDTPATLHPKVKDASYPNPDVPPLAFSIDHSFLTEIDLEVSGLITASTNSIHREELRYFLKTLGKKTSVFFKAESSCLKSHSKVVADIMKRAQEMGHGFVSRVRLPRYINPHFGVELFSTHKAKGAYLLNAISKGHCAQNDFYWGHASLHNDGKYITLVSLQRIHYVEKGSAWGSWNVKWTLETNQLLSPPTVAKNKLILHVTKNEKEASSSMVDWYVESEAADILEWLCRKMNSAMILNMESSIYSK
ncbi:vacuolar protein sorting-associated protein 13C-like isoform X2 [Harpegnathos saltator]|uniref:vacuolar protein sorting-associated protein 13C-like isoform X2 n=1 Tax=Harpegnathos saltator TaxID=610380 RepID=UPI000948C679|nr:vacuolar protein sorting-associated protein 13C-like isoform X2 [Harpegnathos saltator]